MEAGQVEEDLEERETASRRRDPLRSSEAPKLRVLRAEPLSAGEPGDNTLACVNKKRAPPYALHQIKEASIDMLQTAWR